MPFHDDHDPSLHLYSDDRYHCFASGDAVDLYADVKNIDSPVEAAYEFAEEFRIEVPGRDPVLEASIRERRDRERVLLAKATELHKLLEEYPNVRAWWEERGVGEELRCEFLLGATRDGGGATIPHFDHRGRVQGIVLRELAGGYTYPAIEEYAAYERPLMVFGDLGNDSDAYLVEGPIDALAVASVGATAVALGGSALSMTHRRDFLEIAERYPKKRFVALLDSDDASIEASRKVAAELYPAVKHAGVDFSEFADEGPRTRPTSSRPAGSRRSPSLSGRPPRSRRTSPCARLSALPTSTPKTRWVALTP
jgi:DNA primase